MELTSQEAFFNLFIDFERHFLFHSVFPGKDPFKINMEKTFLKFYYLFCSDCYYNDNSCCNDSIIHIDSGISNNRKKDLLSPFLFFFAVP